MAAVLIHEHSAPVTDLDGTVYHARIVGEEEPNGQWVGWIEFVPAGNTGLHEGRWCRTGEETSQPDRAALEYWASGLEPIYLDGALTRALAYRE